MIAKTGVLHSVPARDIELNICRRLYEAWDLRPAHLPRIIRHGRPSCRQGMGGLVATKGMPAMHAEVSPGEAGSPSSFSRNIPRDMIEGTPSNTRRRTYLRSRKLQANGLGGQSSNPRNSKQMTRRTKCKKIAARKTHEVFKTGASECAHTCRWLRVLPVVPLAARPLVLPVVPLPAPIPRYSEPSGDAGRLPQLPLASRLPPGRGPAVNPREMKTERSEGKNGEILGAQAVLNENSTKRDAERRFRISTASANRIRTRNSPAARKTSLA